MPPRCSPHASASAAGYDLTIVSARGTTDHDRERVADRHRSTSDRSGEDRHAADPRRRRLTAARYDEPLVTWIRAAAKSSRRVATVCSGAFIAAEAGLLDGRTVTTHWARAQDLADEYPRVTVNPDPIYVHDGKRVDVGRRDRRHRSCVGDGRGRPRQRRRPDGRPLDGDVPAPPRWADAVRRTGVGTTREPRRGSCGAGLHRHASRRGSSPRPARRPCRDEQPALQPGVHRTGRRDAGTLRRARARRGRPTPSSSRPLVARSSSPPTAVSAPPSHCAAPSNAASAWRPTRTAADFVPIPVPPRVISTPSPRRAYPCRSPYPCSHQFTALDAIGPYEVLQRIPSIDVTFIGKERGEVRSENGMLGITLDATFEEMPHPDIVVFPGGVGTRPLMHDEHVLDWVRNAHETSTFTTSVCTGSLVLGGAGLLDGLDRDDALGVLRRAGSDRGDAHCRSRRRAPRPADHHRSRSVERHRHGPASRRTARRSHGGAGRATDDRVRPAAAVRQRRPWRSATTRSSPE